jgi:circadian clock protein KaiC
VVLDPVSSFEVAGTRLDALSMLMRLIDRFKSQQISTMLTSLTGAGNAIENSTVGVSSLIDGWILLRSLEQGGERTRALYVLKARGIRHSNQVRELLITDQGLDLEQIQVGPDGILVGSARNAQKLRDRIAAKLSRNDLKHRKELLARKRSILKWKIAALESEYAAQARDLERVVQHEFDQQEAAVSAQASLVAQREALAGHGNATRRAK